MIPHFRYRISSFDNQKIRADNSSSQDKRPTQPRRFGVRHVPFTVLVDTPQLLAIARCVSPISNFKRRISSIFRMDKLACTISSSSITFRRGCQICSSLSSHFPPCSPGCLIGFTGISDRHGRNHRSACTEIADQTCAGFPDRHGPDYAVYRP